MSSLIKLTTGLSVASSAICEARDWLEPLGPTATVHAGEALAELNLVLAALKRVRVELDND